MTHACRCYTASLLPWSPAGQFQEGSVRSALLGDSTHQISLQDIGRETDVRKSKRPTPGFGRQYMWCLSRVALQRTREPLTVFTDYAIFALTGTVVLTACVICELLSAAPAKL